MRLVPLSEVFHLSYGDKLDMNKMQRAKNGEGIAFVSRSARNNGVVAMVQPLPGKIPNPAGSLTIALGGSVLSTFLQITPFYTGQNVAVATPKVPMSNNQLIYYAVCIKENAFRYSACGREANRTFKNIQVPAMTDIPAWITQSDPTMFDGKDAPLESKVVALNPSSWMEFRLDELFELKKGKRLTKAAIKPGDIPFIGAIDKNNGVRQMISNTSHLHDGGTITVNYNGSVGQAFYQPDAFWASDDVNVLYPKFDMTASSALFICSVIRQERYRFSYGRKWHSERMQATTIKLPVDANGDPDWAYMEAFIKSLPYSSQID